MKIINLPIDSDISATSLVHAEELIRNEYGEGYYKDTKRIVVKVPSQLMDQAVKLSFCLGYDIEVDFDLQADAWRLEVTFYTCEDGKINTQTIAVYSPGA